MIGFAPITMPDERTLKILEDVNWVHASVADTNGKLKSIMLPSSAFMDDDIWENGTDLDGSSIDGFLRVENSDITAIPIEESLRKLPWTEGYDSAALIFLRTTESGGGPYPTDPRNIADGIKRRAQGMGFDTIRMRIEMEFFALESRSDIYLEPDEGPEYMLPASEDRAFQFRDELSAHLIKMGYPLRYHHHENGWGQQEIEFGFMNGICDVADAAIVEKFASGFIAERHGLNVTYMPKPFGTQAGSGMHNHMYLTKDGKNAFWDAEDMHHLSQTGRYFLGGVLEHISGLAVITNPVINSYKRLYGGMEAPKFVAWGFGNRSALARIPGGEKKSTDIEVRNTDAAANPYLAFAGIVLAGLDGIKKKTDPGEPSTEDLGSLSTGDLRERGIKQLPKNLAEAVEMAESDPLVKELLGEGYDYYLEKKRREWKSFMNTVTVWEKERYFDV